jgi:hypothetical protein
MMVEQAACATGRGVKPLATTRQHRDVPHTNPLARACKERSTCL